MRNKKHLPAIFTSTFITTYLFYTLLGIVLAVYYGDNILGTCSLNFGYYRGGKPFGMSTPIWAELIVYVIILFPAIDVLSAFPLVSRKCSSHFAQLIIMTRSMNYFLILKFHLKFFIFTLNIFIIFRMQSLSEIIFMLPFSQELNGWIVERYKWCSV